MTKTYPQRPFQLPDDATEILLVRHGASQHAVPGERFPTIEGGHADPPLAPEGREQAERVGARLAGEHPDALFVTPQRRTHETAEPLIAATGLRPTVIAELREVHLGEWEGGEIRVRAANRDPLMAELERVQRWDVIPGGEDMDAFGRRVRRGIEAIVTRTGPGMRVVAVLHGGVIAEICHQAVGGGSRMAFVFVENASVTSLIVHPGGRWRMRSYNDTAHLR